MSHPRNPNRRRRPLSTCVTDFTAQAIEEAAWHHSISVSELMARILARACHDGIPSQLAELDTQFPAAY